MLKGNTTTASSNKLGLLRLCPPTVGQVELNVLVRMNTMNVMMLRKFRTTEAAVIENQVSLMIILDCGKVLKKNVVRSSLK